MTRLALLALVCLSGCGYHIAGRGDLLPKNLKTICIPAFGNGTSRPKLPTLLAGEIANEFIGRTRYRIVADPRDADALLQGAVVSFENYPTVLDPVTGRATGVQVVCVVQLKLTDRRTGAVLFDRPGFEFRERYEISTNPQTYFDESGSAMQRVSRDVARSAVTAILEKF
jgi:hypothetical protein